MIGNQTRDALSCAPKWSFSGLKNIFPIPTLKGLWNGKIRGLFRAIGRGCAEISCILSLTLRSGQWGWHCLDTMDEGMARGTEAEEGDSGPEQIHGFGIRVTGGLGCRKHRMRCAPIPETSQRQSAQRWAPGKEDDGPVIKSHLAPSCLPWKHVVVCFCYYSNLVTSLPSTGMAQV